jgi:uncharacterized membrane-anchored protein
MARNPTSPRWIIAKGGLFVVAGLLASILLMARLADLNPMLSTWGAIALFITAMWCASRAYYFAVYVVQHYVDSAYRFDGDWSVAVWLVRSRRPR